MTTQSAPDGDASGLSKGEGRTQRRFQCLDLPGDGWLRQFEPPARPR